MRLRDRSRAQVVTGRVALWRLTLMEIPSAGADPISSARKNSFRVAPTIFTRGWRSTGHSKAPVTSAARWGPRFDVAAGNAHSSDLAICAGSIEHERCVPPRTKAANSSALRPIEQPAKVVDTTSQPKRLPAWRPLASLAATEAQIPLVLRSVAIGAKRHFLRCRTRTPLDDLR